MTKRIIAQSYKSRGGLDDDYTLYDNGEILHEFDKHTYPGGYNHSETLSAEDLRDSVKRRLLDAASEENKEDVRKLLGL